MSPVDQYDDDDDKELANATGRRVYKEFDCPSCNANNPTEEPLADQDEVLCNYCGSQYKVILTDEGRLKLKEL